jgi:hypothetical protein
MEKRVRAFFKTLDFSSPDSIPRDTKTGKMLLARSTCPDLQTRKSPAKLATLLHPKSAIDNHHAAISLFSKCQPDHFP